MSDKIDLPDDLLQIQVALYAARRAADEYAATVAEERRALFPDPEQVVERQQWTPEQSLEMERLRAAYMAACEVKWSHPMIVQAHADRTIGKLDDQLRDAAAKAGTAS